MTVTVIPVPNGEFEFHGENKNGGKESHAFSMNTGIGMTGFKFFFNVPVHTVLFVIRLSCWCNNNSNK